MPVHPIAAGMSVVEQAVKQAADVTGVDFDFLMRTAKRESGFDSSAKASTSSAAGLFQFTEQTWLRVMKKHGSAHGFARYSNLINETPDGRFIVPGDTARKAVMDLRYDPGAAAVMAGELAGEHASYLRGRTGREPTGGELYAAHFLGPQGSAKLIEARDYQPGAAAAGLFPDAAASNHNVFYNNGRALTVSEVYANLTRTAGGDSTVARLTRPDPGQNAFITYASAARSEHQREQQALLGFLLNSNSNAANEHNPVGSLFSTEMLAMMSKERDRNAR